MNVVEILMAGRRRARLAGSPYVDANHVTSAQLDELADDAVNYLRTRDGRPAPVPGWTRLSASQAGLLPYWARLAGLTTEDEKKPFRPLRKDVYDLLDERDLICKPPGQGASVDVSPAGGGEASLRADDLRGRVEQLIRRIGDETGIAPHDYAHVLGPGNPAAELARILLGSTTGRTTTALSSWDRLDLSLEQAALEWAGELRLSPDLVEAARARLAYWRST